MQFEIPPARGGDDKYGKKGQSPCCGPNWQLTAIFWTVLFGTIAFFVLLIVLVVSGPEMQATSRATVAMHEETVKMKEDAETWFKKFRTNFPENQPTVTTEQLLDSIDKVHSITAWVDQVRRGIPPATLHAILNNANTFIGNATLFVEIVGAVFNSEKGTAATPGKRELFTGAGSFLKKGAELITSISPAEFHEAFITTHSAVKSFVRLSENVSHEKVNKIVDSVSDILSAADSSHIVTVISDLTKGVSEVIHRFAQPGGLRLSLPVMAGPDTLTTTKK